MKGPQQRQRQRQLPSPPPGFARRKQRILELLAVPEAEYTDASPKGSVDEGIRELIGEINDVEGFVTTSSCAGRVSVFVEGRKAASVSAGGTAIKEEKGVGEGEGEGEGGAAEARDAATVAAVGGKGGGGAWLFVSHDPVTGIDLDGSDAHYSDQRDEKGVTNRPIRDIKALLGLCDPDAADAVSQIEGGSSSGGAISKDTRLIHFKFEPMVRHLSCLAYTAWLPASRCIPLKNDLVA
jgi:tRNA wybutosine-synthesizing protein 3